MGNIFNNNKMTNQNLYGVHVIRYPDGSFYTEVAEDAFRSLKYFTFRINSYEDLWALLQLVEVLNYNRIEPTIEIPCLFEAQADRVMVAAANKLHKHRFNVDLLAFTIVSC